MAGPYGPENAHWRGPFGALRSLVGAAVHAPAFLRGRARGELSFAFQERIMLAVTSVNRCRYCAALHGRLARSAGVGAEEACELLGGSFEDAPEEERQALEYARRWAETGGAPEAEARERLVAATGEDRVRAIEATIRLIMAGNYTGNTVDHALEKVTGGRLGARREP